jgi:hypothetical protein
MNIKCILDLIVRLIKLFKSYQPPWFPCTYSQESKGSTPNLILLRGSTVVVQRLARGITWTQVLFIIIMAAGRSHPALYLTHLTAPISEELRRPMGQILFTDTTVKISTAIIHDMDIEGCIMVCCKV